MKPLKKTPKTFLGYGVWLSLIIEAVLIFLPDPVINTVRQMPAAGYAPHGLAIGGPVLMILILGGWRYFNKCHGYLPVNWKLFNLVLFPSSVFVLLGIQFHYAVSALWAAPWVVLSALLFKISSANKCPHCRKPLVAERQTRPMAGGFGANVDLTTFYAYVCHWCGFQVNSPEGWPARELERVREELKTQKTDQSPEYDAATQARIKAVVEKFGGMERFGAYVNQLSPEERKNFFEAIAKKQ